MLAHLLPTLCCAKKSDHKYSIGKFLKWKQPFSIFWVNLFLKAVTGAIFQLLVSPAESRVTDGTQISEPH